MEVTFGENMFGDLDYKSFPKMVKVKQVFDCPSVDDVEECVRREVAKPEINQLIKPGMQIAVLAGSRGIAHINTIIYTLIQELKKRGAEPFTGNGQPWRSYGKRSATAAGVLWNHRGDHGSRDSMQYGSGTCGRDRLWRKDLF